MTAPLDFGIITTRFKPTAGSSTLVTENGALTVSPLAAGTYRLQASYNGTEGITCEVWVGSIPWKNILSIPAGGVGDGASRDSRMVTVTIPKGDPAGARLILTTDKGVATQPSQTTLDKKFTASLMAYPMP